MPTLIFILLIAGFVYLVFFHKPHHHSEAELQKWFSNKLVDIALNLEQDIKKDNNGEYPHSGKQTFKKRGTITYVLADKNNSRFDISDKNMLRSKDIMETYGYRKLEEKVHTLNLLLRLEEKDVEGDEVESFFELDEYVDDFPRYYTVTISGW